MRLTNLGPARKILLTLFVLASLLSLVCVLWVARESLERRNAVAGDLPKGAAYGTGSSGEAVTSANTTVLSAGVESTYAKAVSTKDSSDSLGSAVASTPSELVRQITFMTASGAHAFSAVVVDTPELREKGLGGRAGIKKDQAMLFVFESDGRHAFWMKDMLFSIDMVWLDSSKKVVHVESDVSPDTFPEAFGPAVDTRYVIELNAGEAESIRLKMGDTVNF